MSHDEFLRIGMKSFDFLVIQATYMQINYYLFRYLLSQRLKYFHEPSVLPSHEERESPVYFNKKRSFYQTPFVYTAARSNDRLFCL